MNKLKVYHGTNVKSLESIKENGLVDTVGEYHSPTWYMVSTDFASALYHATPLDDMEHVYVVEFEVPLSDDAYWFGYPYFWKGYERSNTSTWFALKEALPKELMTNIHKVDYKTWFDRKNKGY